MSAVGRRTIAGICEHVGPLPDIGTTKSPAPAHLAAELAALTSDCTKPDRELISVAITLPEDYFVAPRNEGGSALLAFGQGSNRKEFRAMLKTLLLSSTFVC